MSRDSDLISERPIGLGRGVAGLRLPGYVSVRRGRALRMKPTGPRSRIRRRWTTAETLWEDGSVRE